MADKPEDKPLTKKAKPKLKRKIWHVPSIPDPEMFEAPDRLSFKELQELL